MAEKEKVEEWFKTELSMCIEESLDAIECEDIMRICLKAFNELEQYKALGTVEELKEAKEQFDNINSCANSVALCGLCDFDTAKESVISTIKASQGKNVIDIDMQIERINSATKELKKHFGKHYELAALTYSIPLLKELKELRKGRKEIPIATIKISKEDMQKIVDEKVAQIELDIQKIREKAIDEFLHNAETKICDRILQNQARLDFASGLSVANRILDEVAEQLKAGGKNE